MLYAGTDEDGLVYRINPADGKMFVLYDAKEAEISSIVIDAEGNVFAATASADNARPGRSVADKPGGSPDRSPSKGKSSETKPAGDGKDKNGHSGGAASGTPSKEATSQPAAGATTRASLGRPVSRSGPEGGNAIYRIDTNGFVTEVFREPVMILSMAETDGTIYAGTGNEGRIYAINAADDRVTMLAKLEASQATSLLHLPDGQLIIGAANAAMLVRLPERRAGKGTLLSKALDAGQVVKWGRIGWTATVPSGTKLTIATRSSNVEDVESNAWDEWSPEMDATVPQQISSSGARFLQYRLTFESSDPQATPTLHAVQIPRIEENRAPELSSLEVVSAREEAQKPSASSMVKAIVGATGFGGPAQPGPDEYWVVKWKAEDPNKDTMEYEVYFRQVGTARWIQMGKEIKESLKIWDTRTVEDGMYQLKVVAKDGLSNPRGTELSSARISDTMTVDNTPPEVTLDRVEPKGEKSLQVHATLTDTRTPITDASYTVDSDEEWVPLAADDDIFDSRNESVTFTVNDLAAGEHRVALRVRDDHGNTRYASRSATTGK